MPKRATHFTRLRLRSQGDVLDEVLTDFGLSPHPSVMLVLEGQTEFQVVPRVMDVLAIPQRGNFIHLFDRGGDHATTLLLRWLALPELGPIESGMAEFQRPPTKVLIVGDGDKRPFRSPAQRDAERQKYVRLLMNSLPPEARPDEAFALEQLDQFVTLEAWDDRGRAFEFAHFSPRQIARAIVEMGRGPAGMDIDSIAVKLGRLRANGGNVKSLGTDG